MSHHRIFFMASLAALPPGSELGQYTSPSPPRRRSAAPPSRPGSKQSLRGDNINQEYI